MSDLSTHRLTVDRFLGGEACDLDENADWPYECVAKDQATTATRVVICRAHNVWWTDGLGGSWRHHDNPEPLR